MNLNSIFSRAIQFIPEVLGETIKAVVHMYNGYFKFSLNQKWKYDFDECIYGRSRGCAVGFDHAKLHVIRCTMKN